MAIGSATPASFSSMLLGRFRPGMNSFYVIWFWSGLLGLVTALNDTIRNWTVGVMGYGQCIHSALISVHKFSWIHANSCTWRGYEVRTTKRVVCSWSSRIHLCEACQPASGPVSLDVLHLFAVVLRQAPRCPLWACVPTLLAAFLSSRPLLWNPDGRRL